MVSESATLGHFPALPETLLSNFKHIEKSGVSVKWSYHNQPNSNLVKVIKGLYDQGCKYNSVAEHFNVRNDSLHPLVRFCQHCRLTLCTGSYFRLKERLHIEE